MVERSNSESGSGTQSNVVPKQITSNVPSGCAEHGYEKIQGYCKDCSCGICFRCAISKHRNHNMANTDEITNADLEPMLDTFDQKL